MLAARGIPFEVRLQDRVKSILHHTATTITRPRRKASHITDHRVANRRTNRIGQKAMEEEASGVNEHVRISGRVTYS